MVAARDLEDLKAEREYLRGVDARRPFFRRWGGYWKLTGPGWMQSAITLGAGTAGSTILAAAAYGYQLLWLPPVAMALGVAVFAAIGRQTLLTGRRPYEVFKKDLHPMLAVFWGLSVLVSSVIFQFPQYALGTDVLRDILAVAGIDAPKAAIVAFFLVASTAICWSYGRGSRQGRPRLRADPEIHPVVHGGGLRPGRGQDRHRRQGPGQGPVRVHHPQVPGGDRPRPRPARGGRGCEHDLPLSLLSAVAALGERPSGAQELRPGPFDVPALRPGHGLRQHRLRQHAVCPRHQGSRRGGRRPRPGPAGRPDPGPGRLFPGHPEHVLHDHGPGDAHRRLRPERDVRIPPARQSLQGRPP